MPPYLHNEMISERGFLLSGTMCLHFFNTFDIHTHIHTLMVEASVQDLLSNLGSSIPLRMQPGVQGIETSTFWLLDSPIYLLSLNGSCELISNYNSNQLWYFDDNDGCLRAAHSLLHHTDVSSPCLKFSPWSFQPQGHIVFLIVVPLNPHTPQCIPPTPSAQMMNDCTLWKGPSPINKLISPLSLSPLPVNNELWVSLLITIIVNVKRGPVASCPTPHAFIDFIFLH